MHSSIERKKTNRHSGIKKGPFNPFPPFEKMYITAEFLMMQCRFQNLRYPCLDCGKNARCGRPSSRNHPSTSLVTSDFTLARYALSKGSLVLQQGLPFVILSGTAIQNEEQGQIFYVLFQRAVLVDRSGSCGNRKTR